MKNPIDSSEIDNGVNFIKRLWDDEKIILEHVTQDQLDSIWSILRINNTLPDRYNGETKDSVNGSALKRIIELQKTKKEK